MAKCTIVPDFLRRSLWVNPLPEDEHSITHRIAERVASANGDSRIRIAIQEYWNLLRVETAGSIRSVEPFFEAIMFHRAVINFSPLRFYTVVVPLLACSFLYSSLSGCQSKQNTETSNSAATTRAERSADAAKPTSSSSVRAYIDPVTGALREPTKEDLAAEAALEAAKSKSTNVGESKSTAPQEVVLPSGAVTIELGESAQQPLIACLQKDGSVKMDHDCPAAPVAK